MLSSLYFLDVYGSNKTNFNKRRGLVAGRYKAARHGPTGQAGWVIKCAQLPTLTANISAEATDRADNIRQGRLARPIRRQW